VSLNVLLDSIEAMFSLLENALVVQRESGWPNNLLNPLNLCVSLVDQVDTKIKPTKTPNLPVRIVLLENITMNLRLTLVKIALRESLTTKLVKVNVKIAAPASTVIKLSNLYVKVVALASTTSKLGNLLNPLHVKYAAPASTMTKENKSSVNFVASDNTIPTTTK